MISLSIFTVEDICIIFLFRRFFTVVLTLPAKGAGVDLVSLFQQWDPKLPVGFQNTLLKDLDTV